MANSPLTLTKTVDGDDITVKWEATGPTAKVTDILTHYAKNIQRKVGYIVDGEGLPKDPETLTAGELGAISEMDLRDRFKAEADDYKIHADVEAAKDDALTGIDHDLGVP